MVECPREKHLAILSVSEDICVWRAAMVSFILQKGLICFVILWNVVQIGT